MNPDKQRFWGFGALIATLIWSIGTGIVFFWLYAILKIDQFTIHIPAIAFCTIDLLIIGLIVISAKAIVRSITVPAYIQLVFLTFIYSLFVLFGTGLSRQDAAVAGFTFFQLCVLFVFIVISAIVISIGRCQKNA